MTQNIEPVAQAPEAPTASAAPARTTGVSAKAWQVLGATALAAATGLGGFVIGSHSDTIRPAGHMERLGDPKPGGPMMGDGRGPGMGPHCEDASGIHAPVGPDGSCPTGFTLDDKGRGGMPVPVPSASPSATS
jgi:hypothetical protein